MGTFVTAEEVVCEEFDDDWASDAFLRIFSISSLSFRNEIYYMKKNFNGVCKAQNNTGITYYI